MFIEVPVEHTFLYGKCKMLECLMNLNLDLSSDFAQRV